jgi:hypothetical protein
VQLIASYSLRCEQATKSLSVSLQSRHSSLFAETPDFPTFLKMSNYREMLEDYRDLDIDELMKGMSEAELLALDEELERDVIQPNPSYSLRAPTPPPPISDDDSR